MRLGNIHPILSLLLLSVGVLIPACSLTSGLDKYDDYTFGGQADAGTGQRRDAGVGGTADADAGDGGQEGYWERFDRLSREASDACNDVPLYCTGGTKLDTDLECPERCHAVSDNLCFCPFLLKYQQEARILCESVGLDLIKIEDEDENNAIGDLLVSLGAEKGHMGTAWIGLADHDSDGVFVWPDGSEATYKPWALGQPDNLTQPDGEQCVIFEITEDNTPDYVWHDWPCEAYEGKVGGDLVDLGHYFFCEKDSSAGGTVVDIAGFNGIATDPASCEWPGTLFQNFGELCCTTIAGLSFGISTEPGRCGIKFPDTGIDCVQFCMPGKVDLVSGCESASLTAETLMEAPCCTIFGDDVNGYACGTWDQELGCHMNSNTWSTPCDKPTAYKGPEEPLVDWLECDGVECELDRPEGLSMAEQCCTDQASVDNFRATAEEKCGIRYLEGHVESGFCLQMRMEGNLDDACSDWEPNIEGPMKGQYLQKGCCTVFGYCGALSNYEKGCRIVADPPYRLCVRGKKDESIGPDPLLLEDYGNCSESEDGRGNRFTFCDGPLEWEQARAACEWKENRLLVRIDDPEENEFLREGFRNTAFWIGARESDAPALDNWAWSDTGYVFFTGVLYGCGTEATPTGDVKGDRYVNWAGCHDFPEADSQPDYVKAPEEDNEKCAQMRTDGFWSDEDCALKKAYVCEEEVP
jgi:hypothetical protein